MNMKSKSILPICLLFSFTACQNVEHSSQGKRTLTSLDKSDTLLGDSNDSERSNPQGGGGGGGQIAS